MKAEYLLYADDLKIFRSISSGQDHKILQSDIDLLSAWCSRNKLGLNIKKCAAVSFSRSHVCPPTNYNLNNETISEIDSIKDLAFKTLGFITRTSKDKSQHLTEPFLLLSLFNSGIWHSNLVSFY